MAKYGFSESSFHLLVLFVYLPILETYPMIYIWYDYNNNKNLAIDTAPLISEMIILLGLLKVK